jgi:hypothetical protein
MSEHNLVSTTYRLMTLGKLSKSRRLMQRKGEHVTDGKLTLREGYAYIP